LVVVADIAVTIAVGSLAPLAALGPALLAPVTLVWRRLSMEWDFTLAESPDGFRLRHGLLETRAQTIPPGRVQALRVVEPLAWRPLGWARVELDVAGYRSHGRGEQRTETSALLPVAPRGLALAVVGRVAPGVDLTALELSRSPRRARLRAPLSFHNLGYTWVAGHAVTRAGVFRRVTDVVPETKLQSLRFVQGPWQRRLGLASLHLDTAGRDVRAVAAQRDAEEARALLDDGAERARHARVADLRSRS
jgi:putative membrane protein